MKVGEGGPVGDAVMDSGVTSSTIPFHRLHYERYTQAALHFINVEGSGLGVKLGKVG